MWSERLRTVEDGVVSYTLSVDRWKEWLPGLQAALEEDMTPSVWPVTHPAADIRSITETRRVMNRIDVDAAPAPARRHAT